MPSLQMRARKPSIREVVVKLNEGVSGEGNANVDLAGLATGDEPNGARRSARARGGDAASSWRA